MPHSYLKLQNLPCCFSHLTSSVLEIGSIVTVNIKIPCSFKIKVSALSQAKRKGRSLVYSVAWIDTPIFFLDSFFLSIANLQFLTMQGSRWWREESWGYRKTAVCTFLNCHHCFLGLAVVKAESWYFFPYYSVLQFLAGFFKSFTPLPIHH